MFIPSDIYTSSGANTLYGCWTANVTKYDTSSFYNWEEDNLPLHDLEERTHLLWERQGHPTSSLTGFAMLVSGAPTETCNVNIFNTLSSCIQKLPDNINVPYLIEVASFGNLGDLTLTDKKFGPLGSIEIINRNFGNIDGACLVDNRGIASPSVYGSEGYGILSGVSISNAVAAAGHNAYVDVPSIPHDFFETSSIAFSSLVCSGTMNAAADSRLTNNFTVFAKMAMSLQQGRMTASLAAANSVVPWIANSSGVVSFDPYEANIGATEFKDTYDASCINELSNSEITWGTAITPTAYDWVTALAYGNRLTKITVSNCNGPIYIRNFTVDGGGASGRKYGIEVNNSSNIIFERCSVARCNKAGLLVDNSDIALTRSFASYRNYNFDSNSNRKGTPWLEKINRKPDPNETNFSSIETGAGILAINSKVSFSSTAERDWTLYSNEWKTWSVSSTTVSALNPFNSAMFCTSRNSIGIHAINSEICGGQSEVLSSPLSSIGWYNRFYNSFDIDSELNTEAGIKLENSKLELDGRLNLYGNFVGLESDNSKISTDMLVARYNQKHGLKLCNSNMNYNKGLYQPHNGIESSVEDSPYYLHQNTFFSNGNHIDLENSVMGPTYTSGIPEVYERFVASGNFGVEGNTQVPAFNVRNNSKLELVHAGIENNSTFSQQYGSVFGQAISVTENSELILNGSKNDATTIIGPGSYDYQEFKSGLFVGSNSKCRISGPTVITQYSVDVLADDNSEINFTPHKTSLGTIDVSGYNLQDAANHTMVELHSTRSCLVADNNSVINMEDLGDYRTQWTTASYGQTVLLSSMDYNTGAALLNTQYYTSAGSIQFYPNPVDLNNYTGDGGAGVASTAKTLYNTPTFTKNAQGFYYMLNQYIGDNTNQDAFSGTTAGGVCLRALNGSKVNAKNVHFPAGWWNPSGIIYDVSAADSEGLCNRLFIWNIADDSQLHASYTSVSGVHPGDVAYHGPRGVYLAGADIASAVPTVTQDTGSESVLDFYGSGGTHNFARSTHENRGPFRVYYSIQPETNWFLTSALDLSGFIPQVYAQGYQFSGNMTYPTGTVSSFYTSVWRNNGGTIEPSGFFYGSALLCNPTDTRVIIDDSGANTFANAKHCSVGKSGMGRVASIYFPYTNTYGGDSANDAAKQYGKGFASTNIFDLKSRN